MLKKIYSILILSLLFYTSCSDCENKNKYYWVRFKNGDIKYYYDVWETDNGLKVYNSPCSEGVNISSSAYDEAITNGLSH